MEYGTVCGGGSYFSPGSDESNSRMERKMAKSIKYILLLAAGLAVLALLAFLVVPRLIDAQKYRTMILAKITTATGRPVSLAGDLKVSVFPWVGVSFSDLRLGNIEGFEAKDFVVVKSFEAHMEVLPLLSRKVQIDHFVIDSPEIYLEKRKDGRVNWQLRGDSPEKGALKKTGAAKAERRRIALQSVDIAEFSILNGTLRYADKQQGTEKEISGLTLQLSDVNLERPIGLFFSAVIDGKAVAGKGNLGPLGAKPGQGTLPLDLSLTAFDQVEVRITGQIDNPAGSPTYKLEVDVAQFSPKKLLNSVNVPFPVETGDPEALEAVAVSMQLSGGLDSVAIADGLISVDGSKIVFTGNVNAFTPLDLVFAGRLDAINLDRYLPPKREKSAQPASAASGTAGQEQSKKTDYQSLRKITLDAKLAIGEVKVKGGTMQDVDMHLTARKGILQLSPLSMSLYGGTFSSEARLDVQSEAPVSSLEAKAAKIQIGPLLRAFTGKDVLEGAMVADVALTTKGGTPETVKKNLNGTGELLFTDGAIVGIDLAGMVRNVQASFGLADRPAEKPRTDFAELRAPFTIKNGLLTTPGTALQSPLIRVTASGDANLVKETLDMKVQPKFVATLKGQGDAAERTGLMVPVLVRGTFSSPIFSPDLTGLLQGQLPDAEAVKKLLEQELSPEKMVPKGQEGSLEKGIKGLIPQLQFK